MAAFELNTAHWPVVVLTLSAELAGEDYARLFDAFEELLRRGEKYLTITDTTKGGVSNAQQRQLIGEWIKKNEGRIAALSLGSVVIVRSTLIRGALTAIEWVSQSKLSTVYVSNMDAALEAARVQLDRAGVRLPRRLAKGA